MSVTGAAGGPVSPLVTQALPGGGLPLDGLQGLSSPKPCSEQVMSGKRRADATGSVGAALRRESNDSSTGSLPQSLRQHAGARPGALATERLPGQSLESLPWMHQPNDQDEGSVREASSIGTFTQGLDTIAQHARPASRPSTGQDDYLLQLLQGRSTAAWPSHVPGKHAATGNSDSAHAPLPTPHQQATGRQSVKASADPTSDTRQLASARPAEPAASNETNAGAPTQLVAAHLSAPQQHPLQHHATLAQQPAALQCVADTAAATRQQVGPVVFRHIRERLLAQQGQFNSQIFALHAAVQRQKQLVAACEEPELYQMAMARELAKAPAYAAVALPAAALGAASASVPVTVPVQAQEAPVLPLQTEPLQEQPQTQQDAAREQHKQQDAAREQHKQAQQQQLIMMQQAFARQHQAAAQAAAHSVPLYGTVAPFDPMAAWYAHHLGCSGGGMPSLQAPSFMGPQAFPALQHSFAHPQQPFGGFGPLSLQQQAQQPVQGQVQSPAGAQQLQGVCGAVPAPAPLLRQAAPQQLSVLFAGPVHQPGPPGSGLPANSGGGGQRRHALSATAPPAVVAARTKPVKWWQDARVTFGPAAVPPIVECTEGLHGGRDSPASRAQPSAVIAAQSTPAHAQTTATPHKPLAARTRAQQATASRERGPPEAPAATKKRSRSCSFAHSSREEHMGQNNSNDRNGASKAAKHDSAKRPHTRRQAGGSGSNPSKRSADSISSGCSKANAEGPVNHGASNTLNPKTAPAALQSAADILLSFSGATERAS